MKEKLSQVNFNDYKPLRDIIFEALREAIIMGEFTPGERLMEIKLADKMGVSRTPVREAIRKLELEGFVVMTPRKGAQVADLSQKQIKDVLEVRAVLDALAATLAVERCEKEDLENLKRIQEDFKSCIDKRDTEGAIKKDVEFHSAIYAIAKNDKLISIASGLREQVQRFRVLYIKDMGAFDKLSVEHEEIIQALAEGDKDKCSVASQMHIHRQEDDIIKSIIGREGK